MPTKKSLLHFYRKLPRTVYPRLHKRTAELICMFGSTYICEQFFSEMKINKSRARSNITDENFNSVLRLVSAQGLKPNIERIVNRKRQL